jgi:hypothetical protein
MTVSKAVYSHCEQAKPEIASCARLKFGEAAAIILKNPWGSTIWDG